MFLSFLGGGLLGLFFFGGLWWTVQKITGSGGPYLLFVASFLVRTTVVLGGFYLLLTVGWQYLLAAMAGFLLARTVLANKLKPLITPPKREGTSNDH
ncbi:MAG: ATP synthase subunit I [Dethiobacteria bacterium]|nr:ATP synthase subunit I [Dethiobacteria bacterium]